MKSIMKVIFSVITVFIFATAASAVQIEEKPSGSPNDAFPAGQDSPEGVACELANAFINADVSLWKKITIRKYMTEGSDSGKQYADFLEDISKSMEEQAKLNPAKRAGPRKIEKCFEARHLSKSGPASYGYAVFGFQDIMFVDLITSLSDGEIFNNRTLVIKDKDGKWYVHPMPLVSPLLCGELNQESASTKEYSSKPLK